MTDSKERLERILARMGTAKSVYTSRAVLDAGDEKNVQKIVAKYRKDNPNARRPIVIVRKDMSIPGLQERNKKGK